MSEIIQLKQNVEQIQTVVQQQLAVGGSGSITPGEGQDMIALRTRCQNLELKVTTFEGIVTTLHREIERCLTQLDTFDRDRSRPAGGNEDLLRKIETLERALAQKDVQNAQLEQRLMLSETATYNGEQIWRIDDWNTKRRNAVSGTYTSLFSAPFYTSKTGYKLCTR